MSAQRVFTVTGEAALRLLRLTHASTNLLPPLKRAAGDVLEITELVANFRTSKKEWHEFQAYVRDAVATILSSLGQMDVSQTEVRANAEQLKLTLDEIVKSIQSIQNQSLAVRFLRFMEYPDMIADMRKKLDAAIDLFKLGTAIRTEIIADKTLRVAQNNGQILSSAALNATLSKLRYVEGASWDPRRVCLLDTRNNVIEDILSWVENPESTNILLLTGVAGSGKSTIAHTVAQRCHANKQLVTSFFFDRETNDRNNPKHLISTIAADLCGVDGRVASRISAAIEEDKSLAGAPISRQFEELILQPSEGLPTNRPLVIILDALDEGCSADLLQILCDDVCRLPGCFRLFITSRMNSELEELRQASNVRPVELNTHGQENMSDIALFVPHRLKQVAKRHKLGDSWPGQELATSFEARAEGLFLWVATTCDYLCTRSDPTEELRKLAVTSSSLSTSAEAKMDQLYVTILQTCDWSDEAFVRDYQRLMGSAVATKTPLTLSALNALHEQTPLASNLVLQQLSPLLTGLNEAENTSQPVRFLHQSLRDFLTLRAKDKAECDKFAIDELGQSQTLAYLCLRRMNCDLNDSIPDIGYIAKDKSQVLGIPAGSQENLPEQLWYACQFWAEHVLDIEPSSTATVLEQLRDFLTTKFTTWIEVVASCGRYEGISRLLEWLKEQPYDQPAIVPSPFLLATPLTKLATRLSYMDRREEALSATQDVVMVYRQLADVTVDESRGALAKSLAELSLYFSKLGYHENALAASTEALELYRELAKQSPDGRSADLASSLHRQSIDLSNLGRFEEALIMIQESVKIWRRLAADDPATFSLDLAAPLHSLSIYLSVLGSHEEALTTIQEAVEIRRQLATDRPATFDPDLAESLNSLSVDLSDLGRHEEALKTIQEAVAIRRQLVADRPASFSPDLASSLHNLARTLSYLNRRQEALEAISEAVNINRRLAIHRPAAFNQDLAHALHNMSLYLSNVKRHEEALTTVQEAVEIRRQLAANRPTAFNPDFADSLNSLSARLFDLGRHEEALTAVQEAVDIRRSLVANLRAGSKPELAHSLYNLSIFLAHNDRHQQALEPIKESVELYRPLAASYPVIYNTDLFEALELLATILSATAADDEALVVRQEAQAIARQQQ